MHKEQKLADPKLRELLDAVTLTEYEDALARLDEDLRRGIGVLRLLSSRDWLSRCTENYVADRIDSLQPTIEIDVQPSASMKAALDVQRPGPALLPILVVGSHVGSPIAITNGRGEAVPEVSQATLRRTLAVALARLCLNDLPISAPGERRSTQRDLTAVLAVAFRDYIDPPGLNVNDDESAPNPPSSYDGVLRSAKDGRDRVKVAVTDLDDYVPSFIRSTWVELLDLLANSYVVAVADSTSKAREPEPQLYAVQFSGIDMVFPKGSIGRRLGPIFGEIDISVPTLFATSRMNHHTKVFVGDGIEITRPSDDKPSPTPVVRLYAKLPEQARCAETLQCLLRAIDEARSKPSLTHQPSSLASRRAIATLSRVCADDLSEFRTVLHEYRFAVVRRELGWRHFKRRTPIWKDDHKELAQLVADARESVALLEDGDTTVVKGDLLPKLKELASLVDKVELGRGVREEPSGSDLAHFRTPETTHSRYSVSTTQACTVVRVRTASGAGLLAALSAGGIALSLWAPALLSSPEVESGWRLYQRQSIAAILAIVPTVLAGRLTQPRLGLLAARLNRARYLQALVIPFMQILGAMLVLGNLERSGYYLAVVIAQGVVLALVLSDVFWQAHPNRPFAKRMRRKVGLLDADFEEVEPPPKLGPMGRLVDRWDSWASQHRWRKALRPLQKERLRPVNLSALEDVRTKAVLAEATAALSKPPLPVIRHITHTGSGIMQPLQSRVNLGHEPKDRIDLRSHTVLGLLSVAGRGSVNTIAVLDRVPPSQAVGERYTDTTPSPLEIVKDVRWGAVDDSGRMVEIYIGVGEDDFVGILRVFLVQVKNAMLPVLLVHAPAVPPSTEAAKSGLTWMRIRVRLPSRRPHPGDTDALTSLLSAAYSYLDLGCAVVVHTIAGRRFGDHGDPQVPTVDYGGAQLRSSSGAEFPVAFSCHADVGVVHRILELANDVSAPDGWRITSVASTDTAGHTVVLVRLGHDVTLPTGHSDALSKNLSERCAELGVRVFCGDLVERTEPSNEGRDRQFELKWRAPEVEGVLDGLIAGLVDASLTTTVQLTGTTMGVARSNVAKLDALVRDGLVDVLDAELATASRPSATVGPRPGVCITYAVCRVVAGESCRGRLLGWIDVPHSDVGEWSANVGALLAERLRALAGANALHSASEVWVELTVGDAIAK